MISRHVAAIDVRDAWSRRRPGRRKEAARVPRARSTRASRTRRSPQMARGLEEKAPARSSRPTAHDLERARGRRARPRLRGPPHPHRERAIEEMAAGLRHVAAPARSGRRDRRRPGGGRRPRDRPGARAARRHRVHLRVPAQRHRGRRRPLPEVGQRGAAARRQRGARVQHPASPRSSPRRSRRRGCPPRRSRSSTCPTARRSMAMLTLDRYLDLIIPRGGEEFVRLVAERATVPVLKHDKGLCHVYVDDGRRPRHGGWRSRSTPRPSG